DPVTQEAMPFTLKDAADAYVIIIQGGAILAVVILYWGRIWGMVEGLVFLALTPLGKFNPALERRLRGNTRAREGMLLARNLISAFLPAAIFGLLLDDWIEDKLFDVLPVITALVAGSFLMFAVERMRKRKTTFRDLDVGPDLHELNIRQCVIVGLLQCVAMWPGTSRSMMTIVGGYVVGLNPVRAAEFSFLLGFITLSAASGYKALTVGQPMLEALDLGPVLFGIAVATISAALAVRWLVAYLTRHGLALFAWYRIALAVAVIFLWEA
ncbi:MAG: undecaprenyl-diphosphate phosphatase, partial [Opitutales bacterium]